MSTCRWRQVRRQVRRRRGRLEGLSCWGSWGKVELPKASRSWQMPRRSGWWCWTRWYRYWWLLWRSSEALWRISHNRWWCCHDLSITSSCRSTHCRSVTSSSHRIHSTVTSFVFRVNLPTSHWWFSCGYLSRHHSCAVVRRTTDCDTEATADLSPSPDSSLLLLLLF